MFELLRTYKTIHGHPAVLEINEDGDWFLYDDLASDDPIATGNGEQSLLDKLAETPQPYTPEDLEGKFLALQGTPEEKKAQAHDLMAYQLRYSGYFAAINVYGAF